MQWILNDWDLYFKTQLLGKRILILFLLWKWIKYTFVLFVLTICIKKIPGVRISTCFGDSEGSAIGCWNGRRSHKSMKAPPSLQDACARSLFRSHTVSPAPWCFIQRSTTPPLLYTLPHCLPLPGAVYSGVQSIWNYYSTIWNQFELLYSLRKEIAVGPPWGPLFIIFLLFIIGKFFLINQNDVEFDLSIDHALVLIPFFWIINKKCIVEYVHPPIPLPKFIYIDTFWTSNIIFTKSHNYHRYL